MNESKLKVVGVAVELFARYGVKRTSMAEVAEQAGISRQTLYAQFSSKDKLLAAAMQSIIGQIYIELESEWEKCNSLDGILATYFKHAVYQPFEMLKKTPDLKDLIHGVGEETTKVAQKAEAEKTKLLAKQLEPFGSRLDAVSSDPTSVAHFVVTTTNELKYSVTSRRELDKLLKTLKLAIQAMLEK